MNIVKNVSLLILSMLYGSSIYSMEHTATDMDIFQAALAGNLARIKELITADQTIVHQL